MSTSHRKIVIRERENLFPLLVNAFIASAKEAIERDKLFTVALSGGRTPVPFFQQLAEIEEDIWLKTHIFLVDERFVPWNDQESNYRLMNEHLIDHLPIPRDQIHPIATDFSSLQEGAQAYERDLRKFFRKIPGLFPSFDFILLGIGEDGHTASLFSGTPALARDNDWVVTTDSAALKQKRISFSLPLINAGRKVFFLVTGPSKSQIVFEILKNEQCRLPAALVKPQPGMLYFFLDQDAISWKTS